MADELDQRVVQWAIDALGPNARITSVKGLRFGSNPWLLHVETTGSATSAVLRVGDSGIATEVAALRIANQNGLPAPIVLAADVDGTEASRPAVLSTVLPGTSRIPVQPTPERLRTMGAITAAIGQVEAEPTPELPLRNHPISLEDFDADRGTSRSSSLPLMESAVQRLEETAAPDGTNVLVHGDFWQGNTLWADDETVGLIDWDMAGVGKSGIDLASARIDAAIMFGQDAVADVRSGWEQVTGKRAENVPYWDVVAAISTPVDMDLWRPQIHAQGRTDLTSAIMNARRDAFLRAALKQF